MDNTNPITQRDTRARRMRFRISPASALAKPLRNAHEADRLEQARDAAH